MEKKIAVVTGVASGIGKAIKEKLACENIIVLGVDKINPEIDENIQVLDVTKEDKVMLFWDDVHKKFGKVDYLINCAGIFFSQERKEISALSINEIEEVFHANFIGSFLMLKYAIPLLKKSESGSVMNISSDQTFYPRKRNLPYLVSKSAINSMTKLAACELAEYKIRVNAIAVASVRTHFIDRLFQEDQLEEVYRKEDEGMPLGLIEAGDVADFVEFLVSDKAKRITGQVYVMDSGKYLDVEKK